MNEVVKTKWFHYRQNNSGGDFHVDDAAGLGPHVWIEANDSIHADLRAQEIGIYFDGVENGRDCSCCGDRWSRLASYSWEKGEETIVIDIEEGYTFAWHDKVYAHPLNGTVHRFKKGI